jgi:hypothetical protein
MNSWSLRDEIFTFTHRWPVIVVCFLIGSLLGWGAVELWPSPFRATATLYVGLDPQQTLKQHFVEGYAGVDFGNLTDFKHWQMAQLEVLALSDEYLGETLARLQEAGADWDDTDLPALKRMVHLSWRNAGEWQLTAEDYNPRHARLAVKVWREVIFEKTNASIASSRQLYALDIQLRSIIESQALVQARLETASGIQAALTAWQKNIQANPTARSLETAERWWLLSLAGRAAGWNPRWRLLLTTFPPEASLAEHYLPWVGQITSAMKVQMEASRAHLDTLAQERAKVEAEWESLIKQGRGLAATLTVDKPSGILPSAVPVRQSGLAAVVGGVLGLVGWGLWVVWRLTQKSK